MVLVCAPGHALARNLAVQTRELTVQKYVHFDRNLVIRRKVDAFLRQEGVSVDVVLEFDNIENIKQAVALGAGVALLPEPTVRREAKAGTLAALPLLDATFTRPLGIIHRRQHLSVAARAFLDLLLKNATERPNGLAPGNGIPSAGLATGLARVSRKHASVARNGALVKKK
jgi:DNA-binding transcriptional LysR family regulator